MLRDGNDLKTNRVYSETSLKSRTEKKTADSEEIEVGRDFIHVHDVIEIKHEV